MPIEIIDDKKDSQTLPQTAIPRYKRIEELKDLGRTIGFWNIPMSEMAKKYGVSRRTIYTDVQTIFKKGIDKDSVEKAIVQIDSLNQILCKGLLTDFLKAKTATERSRTAMALSQIQRDMTDFLEKYGFKQKVADKIDIDQRTITIKLENINLNTTEHKEG